MNIASDSSLSSLTFSKGLLTPLFSSGNKVYTLSGLSNTDTSITVTAQSTSNAAVIRIGSSNTLVSSGVGFSYTVAVGSNTLNLIVTAQDAVTVSTYTITITRPACNYYLFICLFVYLIICLFACLFHVRRINIH